MAFGYTYVSHEEEFELCALEMLSLFGIGITAKNGFFVDHGSRPLSMHRSPYLKRRVHVAIAARSIEELLAQLADYESPQLSFKVVFTDGDRAYTFGEKRELERLVGAAIRGKADMRKPDRRFGLVPYNGGWLFGECEDHNAVWLKHRMKPQNYSTALPARAARAIVNTAAGFRIEGMKMIDPCCGMGTVLIEALSMGIMAEGMDRNPLAVKGARINLRHFGYGNLVRLGDMREIAGSYDTAVIDLPYNLCSVMETEELLSMLRTLRRIARRAVVITTEHREEQLEAAGFTLKHGAVLRKGAFARQISVVE
ncbi:methyltransferase domain-containing protein [Paenibacillus sp. HB172176]|uniref:TRM11 family SAM-dependent methyltransferase n=1 Tax=Paenibacillus sp. HB172176 TaxID=2493690 RepID=UPI0014396E62|nr:methyltransferase domain-containing protein [Paenibacillus sp. HB172176]